MIKHSSHDYLTLKSVSRMVGFSEAHLRRLLTEGKIKGEKIGHNWLVKKSDAKVIKRSRAPKRG